MIPMKKIKHTIRETEVVEKTIEVEVPSFYYSAMGVWAVLEDEDNVTWWLADDQGLRHEANSLEYIIEQEKATAEEFLAALSDAKMKHINDCAMLVSKVEEII